MERFCIKPDAFFLFFQNTNPILLFYKPDALYVKKTAM
jgi:hypothetical protein